MLVGDDVLGVPFNIAFPFGEGGLTRLSAAVKTEEVVAPLTRYCGSSPQGEPLHAYKPIPPRVARHPDVLRSNAQQNSAPLAAASKGEG